MKLRSLFRYAAGSAGLLALSYGAYVARTWIRYGRSSAQDGKRDPLLDRFMPTCDVAERHQTHVAAPAALTFAAAREMDLDRSRLARAIFRCRELLLGSHPEGQASGPLLRQVLALGWGMLAEVPDREIVMGAVTAPWEADVRFRALPPGEFAPFHEPGLVKIAWTLAVEPTGPATCVLSTETRVATTDPESRSRFRRYWAFLSPGILLIRRQALALVKADAEHRQAAGILRSAGATSSPLTPDRSRQWTRPSHP